MATDKTKLLNQFGSNVAKSLDAAAEKYDVEVQGIADRVFRRTVKPFCDRRNFALECGMGTWNLRDLVTMELSDSDDAQRFGDAEMVAIAYLLDMLIPLMPANNLGSLMHDYNPKNK